MSLQLAKLCQELDSGICSREGYEANRNKVKMVTFPDLHRREYKELPATTVMRGKNTNLPEKYIDGITRAIARRNMSGDGLILLPG